MRNFGYLMKGKQNRSKENGHHHHDQTPNPDKDEPEAHPRQKETDLYTCPMHPEVKQAGPGSCPKCGMALEPEGEVQQKRENPEQADMRRRFWVSLILTLPIFIMAMGDLIPGNPLARIVSKNVLVWSELLLATPVVLWGGWPFMVRGWQSVVSWNLNMFTLIGLGVTVAYVYSLIAAIFPEIFPASFKGKEGTVAVYFESVTGKGVKGSVDSIADRLRQYQTF
jgi:P-type Cu+ transporter